MLRPEDQSTDFSIEDLNSLSFFAEDQPNYAVRLGAATHQGNVRPRNEDHYAVFRRARTCDMLMTNLDSGDVKCHEDLAYAMVVADGMGGAAFGDFASRLALQVMFEMAHRATSWLMKFNENQAKEIRERVDAYISHIRRVFRQQGKNDPRMKKMGTTWTSAHLFPPHAILVHIGDSRAYLWHDASLRQITRDQTLAQDLVDAGVPADRVKGFRHVLTNSISADAKDVTANVIHLKLEAGDRLLLCTDGLSDVVDKAEISKLVETGEPQAVCDQLVERALSNGGRDNVTVVLAEIGQRTVADASEA